jgi:rhodanese-related sulfurtransferase
MFSLSRRLLVGAALAALTLSPLAAPSTRAAETPSEAGAQVKSGLYVTAREAWSLMQADSSVILIDVRDPTEMMFTGFTPETDIHVPYMTANPSQLNPKKGGLMMDRNPTFADQVEAKLIALGADKAQSKVIFMCRSGSSRSAPAADLLYDRGWQQTYTMVDGFEGGKRADGPSKGVRDVDGWRNSGLPWNYRLPPEIVTLTP